MAKRHDRSVWKMSPEQLQQHLMLRGRATRIPDKKKENAKKACRGHRQAFGRMGARPTPCA
ncbi:DEAD/DEAH box helicase [Corynebacterium vitaeruminis]|uniref:DEAD/DEAH box helicase n=1 Tax=Corynebacterium vitaeruminis TaxID=38305 RepID=UPI0009DFFEE6|nr:DEAD/DEAH box helicase [Corynebacterium vitaeruminis]